MGDEPSISAADLADRLEGTLEGDATRVIRGVATLEQAGPDDLSWVGSRELIPRMSGSKAGVVLVPKESSPPAGHTIIRVADPDMALCEALRCLAPPLECVEPGVHATAVVAADAVVEGAAVGAHVYVGAGAVVGAGTQLHPGVYVGSHTKIGRDCVLWPNVVVRERITLGDRVIIHPNATIGADGFGYHQRQGINQKIPQIGTVIIEDDVEIGANSTVDRARSGVTRVRRGTKIDDLVIIAHNCDIGEDCVIAAMSGVAGSSTLGHHVAVGGSVGIIDHVRVGNGVQVAAKSLVASDIPDGKIVRGIPVTDGHLFLREQASLRKLPEWIKRMRDLVQRVERLEEQTHGNS